MINPFKGKFHKIWRFFNGHTQEEHRFEIYRRYFLKFLCCFDICRVIQFKRSIAVNAKNLSYLFPVLIGLPLANASKIYRIYGDVTLSDCW